MLTLTKTTPATYIAGEFPISMKGKQSCPHLSSPLAMVCAAPAVSSTASLTAQGILRK